MCPSKGSIKNMKRSSVNYNRTGKTSGKRHILFFKKVI